MESPPVKQSDPTPLTTTTTTPEAVVAATIAAEPSGESHGEMGAQVAELSSRSNFQRSTARSSSQQSVSAEQQQDNEPAKLREWLAREIKSRLEESGRGRPELQSTAERRADAGSGNAEAGGRSERQRRSRTSQLERLINERPRSWSERRTVIVDIKNRRQEVEPKSDAAKRQVGESTSDDSLGAANRETCNLTGPEPTESATLALEARAVRPSSARQSEGQKSVVGADSRETSNGNRQPVERPEAGEASKQIDQSNQGGGARRLPTFGGIPRKLSRLPYFSYYGRARNVDLVTAADRANKQSNENIHHLNSDGSAASLSSSSRSLSSPASGSRIPTLNKTSGSRAEPEIDLIDKRRGVPVRNRPRGFSNFSNLFPERPTAGLKSESAPSAADQRRRYSSSLLNLSKQQHSDRASSKVLASPAAGRRNSLTAGEQSRNRSSYSLNLSPNSQASDRSADRQQQATMRRQNSGGNYAQRLPATATRVGTYKGRAPSAGHLTKQHRSPSASSLLHSGAGLSPYGPPDPDCPVHGQPATATSRSSQNLGPGAELLYEPGARSPNNRASSLYSPTSAGSPTYGGRSTPGYALAAHRYNPGAYYNNSSRFSMYHSVEGGGGLRSQLAPTGEQLRRILGYQPPTKPVHLHPQWAYSRPFIHLQGGRSPSPGELLGEEEFGVRYEPYNQLQDAQAIRAVDFHPSGEVYAVGSNSRALRICAYPADHELRHFSAELEQPARSPRVLFKFLQVHRGSIYCVRFNEAGQLLATGSNDQTVHIVRYNPATHSPDGDEFRLTMHDGTVRALRFIDDASNGASLLLSAGGGDNKIYVTDCDTITPFQSMAGHSQMVMALDHWGGANFVSASYDKTVRFWDLRSRACSSIVSAPPSYGTAGNWAGPGAPACSVEVDSSGRLLASGHSDSTCMLYDIRAARIIQTFRPHDDEIRTLSFSPKSYYLLTGGYDGRLVLSDLQGDLTQPLPSVCAAESGDKVVQAKWHPSDFTFVSTSADRSATLWALPSD